MTSVTFFEKTGCINNTKQKQQLKEAGYEVVSYDLRSLSWSADQLEPFFQGLEVSDWFNKSAPAIKSGELDVSCLTSSEALDLMCQDPILIRRPLLEVGGLLGCGFSEDVLRRLGLSLTGWSAPQEACPRSHEPCNSHAAG